MGTLMLILMIIAIVLAIWTSININDSIWGRIGGAIILTLLYWCVVALIVIFLTEVFRGIANKKEVPLKTMIYGINKETTIRGGSFVIGCGNIDKEYRYSYYVKYGKTSGFILDDVRSKNTVIIEDEEIQPYILKNKVVIIINPKWKNWILEMKRTEVKDDDEIIEIHVPKGTIVQEVRGKL
jgi:hypothetical protein